MHPPRKTTDQRLRGRQAELLAIVRESILDKGRPPTVREVMRRMRTAHARIYPNVERLIELGYLKRGDPVGTLRVKL